MNVSKRTFNPLLSKLFRYEQAENTELKYRGNWGPIARGETVSSSTWEVESGNATLSSESVETGNKITSVIITGSAGESKIINTVTFSDGQVDSREILLRINSDSDGTLINDYWGDQKI
jgi:hypothetical protein